MTGLVLVVSTIVFSKIVRGKGHHTYVLTKKLLVKHMACVSIKDGNKQRFNMGGHYVWSGK